MNPQTEANLIRRIIVIWFVIVPLVGLWYARSAAAEPISLSIFPMAPRPDLPTLVTTEIANDAGSAEPVQYRFFVNGQLLADGRVALSQATRRTFQYVRRPSLDPGERISFSLETSAGGRSFARTMSLPSYPPQVWTSFVSFASFSTSVTFATLSSSAISSIVTTSYYSKSYGTAGVLNVGLAMTLVLLLLLIFLEMTIPLGRQARDSSFEGGKAHRAQSLRLRGGPVALILFVVFAGMVLTRLALIFGLIPAWQ